ncbi:MAG TPA: hypothetical protein VGQ81_13930 [Acidobacteriota bacterium]|jgi:hypothetical protein|nr:hypothetical protein [Acidobacteriota bacterium]
MSPEGRVKALLEAPPNSWVAFSEDESKVVGYGSTYEQAVLEAEKNGVTEPVLVKTPDSWIDLALTN